MNIKYRDLRVFNFIDNPVRVYELQGEPWFSAQDVAKALGIQNARPVLADFDADYATVYNIYGGKAPTQAWFVSEPGLYSLIFKSRKPQAKRFQRWVFNEVLPAIRRTGEYKIEPKLRNDSIQARNGMTWSWLEHGAKAPYHFQNLTRREYQVLGIGWNAKKSEMTREEIARLAAFEALEALNLEMHDDIQGFHELDESLKKTSDVFLEAKQHLEKGVA